MKLNNNIQTQPKQPSFQAGLNLFIKSKQGEMIFDGVRQALIPKNNELISKIQRRALNDDIFITEIADKKQIAIELQKSSDGNHYTGPIMEVINPQEYKTSQDLGALINSKIDKMYEAVSELRKGLRIQ